MEFLSNWFQLTPVSGSVINGYYDLTLVALSYVVAVLASYAALTLVGRLRTEKNSQVKIYWLIGGAFCLGAGIWSMHFIGMLAFSMPMPMEYELKWTVISLLIAMLASALAFFILQKKNYSHINLALGGILIGLGIASMHYTGMEGMKHHVTIRYLPGLFFLSVFIAIFAAEAALLLALKSNEGSEKQQSISKLISAFVMGVAICGMHYTGMAAAVFTSKNMHSTISHAGSINPNYLAFFIAGITFLILSIALTVSTYYKKMINAIDNEKEFLNAMLDNLDDGIVACNELGEITVFNKALQNYVSIMKDKRNIKNLPEYYILSDLKGEPVEKDKFPLKLALEGQRIHEQQYLMSFKNNIQREVIIDGQPIINAQGVKLGAVTVIHDVTELRKTEKLKSEFISIVSHELRTPLTSIRGSLGLLVSGVMGEFPEKAKNLLEIANNNCERLLLLISDILDIEKIEAGKMDFQLKPVNLNDLLMESIEQDKMYADKFGVTMELIQPDFPVQIIADPARLKQVLANLLSNACKFSPRDGKVTVQMEKTNETVRVSVIDYGKGISEEFQSRIFQKFSQEDSSDRRGKGGTGLGLNISKIIVEKMGGKIDFYSKLNEGTTFFFDFPIYQDHSVSQEQKNRNKQSKRLLICEDDADQSEYLKVLLESAGFSVDTATTIAEARNRLKSCEYKALLLDLILPDQDGISFIREIRNSEQGNLRIIVLSVIAQTGRSILNGDAFSIVDWLEKPIDFNKLLIAINRLSSDPAEKPTILHVEDNVDHQQLVHALIGDHANIDVANDLEEAKEKLKKNMYKLIILDLVLPDASINEVLSTLTQSKIPILVFSEKELHENQAKLVRESLIKSSSSNDILLKTIMNLIQENNNDA